MFKIILKKDNEEKTITLPYKFKIDFRKEDVPEEYSLIFLPKKDTKLQDILLTVRFQNKFEYYTEKRLVNNVKFFTYVENIQTQRKDITLNSKDSVFFSIVISHKSNEYLFSEIELYDAKEI